MNQNLWEKLRKLIAQRIGFNIRLQDLKYFQLKVEKRMKLLNLNSLQEYYNLLYNSNLKPQSISYSSDLLGKKEWKELINVVTNGESFFFRDRGQLDTIANEILPQIIAEKERAKKTNQSASLSLKIWSAGCSTGEEVYSLAIIIAELIHNLDDWEITIIGTDINQSFLDFARQGIYKKWSFRLTDQSFKTKYFIADGKHWQLKPHLKKLVSFYQDNLIDPTYIAHHNYNLDLVICRNVFIYFSSHSIVKAIKKVTSTLRYKGYLITGHTELESTCLTDFKLINFPNSVVYQYIPNYQPRDSLSSNKIASNKSKLHRNNDSNLQPQLSFDVNSNLASHQPSADPKDRASDSQQTIKKIQQLLQKEEYSAVIEQGTKLVDSKINSKEGLQLIAQAYANQGNLSQAKQYCNRALEIDYTYIAPLFLLAQIAEMQNEYRQAKELLKKIIYVEPLSVAAYLDLGEIYLQENDIARSQKMYQTAYNLLVKMPPQDSISHRGQKIKNVSQLLNDVKHKL